MNSTFMNKNIRRTVLASTVALGMFGASNAFATPTREAATVTAHASVFKPLKITGTTDLNFGKFAPGSAEGTVIISPNGDRSIGTGGVVISSVSGGNEPTAGSITIGGEPNATYDIAWGTITPLSITSEAAGTKTMSLKRISSLSGDSSLTTETDDIATESLNLGVGGTQTIHLGGILTVATDQVAGDYTGSIEATFQYN